MLGNARLRATVQLAQGQHPDRNLRARIGKAMTDEPLFRVVDRHHVTGSQAGWQLVNRPRKHPRMTVP